MFYFCSFLQFACGYWECKMMKMLGVQRDLIIFSTLYSCFLGLIWVSSRCLCTEHWDWRLIQNLLLLTFILFGTFTQLNYSSCLSLCLTFWLRWSLKPMKRYMECPNNTLKSTKLSLIRNSILFLDSLTVLRRERLTMLLFSVLSKSPSMIKRTKLFKLLKQWKRVLEFNLRITSKCTNKCTWTSSLLTKEWIYWHKIE
jgi:hypothetical protein